MGCDIHAAIEFRGEGGRWVALLFPNKYYGKYGATPEEEPPLTPRLALGRDYDMFAILANVRNGSGFAGIKTGDGFHFISDGRGLPADITPAAKQYGCTGDHSDTWVSLREILEFDWNRTTTLTGVVNAVEFEQWDRMKEWEPQPPGWCGDVSGGSVRHVTVDTMRRLIKEVDLNGKGNPQIAVALEEAIPSTYTRIHWILTYAQCAEQIWLKILPHMLKLGSVEAKYENVRLVMNFDS